MSRFPLPVVYPCFSTCYVLTFSWGLSLHFHWFPPPPPTCR